MNYLYIILVSASPGYENSPVPPAAYYNATIIAKKLETVLGKTNRYWSIMFSNNNVNSVSGFLICKSILEYDKFSFDITNIIKEYYPGAGVSILQVNGVYKINSSTDDIIKAVEPFIICTEKLSDKDRLNIIEKLEKEEMILNIKKEHEEKLSNETKSSKSKLEAKIKELETSKKEEMEAYKAAKDKEYQVFKDSLLEQDKLSKTMMVDENEVSIVKDICLSKIFVYKAYISLYEDLINSSKNDITNIKRLGYYFIIPISIIISITISVIWFSVLPQIVIISIFAPIFILLGTIFYTGIQTEDKENAIRKLKNDAQMFNYSDLESYLNDLKFKMSLAQFDKIKTTIIKQYNVSNLNIGLFTSDQVDKKVLEIQSKRVENIEVNKLLNS